MKLKEIDVKEIMPGLNGRMVHGETITWAFWDIKKRSRSTDASARSRTNYACSRRSV